MSQPNFFFTSLYLIIFYLAQLIFFSKATVPVTLKFIHFSKGMGINTLFMLKTSKGSVLIKHMMHHVTGCPEARLLFVTKSCSHWPCSYRWITNWTPLNYSTTFSSWDERGSLGLGRDRMSQDSFILGQFLKKKCGFWDWSTRKHVTFWLTCHFCIVQFTK